MTRLTWNKREYEIGLDRGVYYPEDEAAQAWSGLISVDETSEDISDQFVYLDGHKIANSRSREGFAASISAYSFPTALLDNPQELFGLSYRVRAGDRYLIHLVYNAMARPSTLKYDQNQPTPFSFSISTRPVLIPYAKSSAHLIIDANSAWPEALAAFEAILYGDTDNEPRLPMPEEVYNLFDINAVYRVIDNGDGTVTLDGPDAAFVWIDPTEFTVEWPQIVYLDQHSYLIKSW
jgi:hypothetical protein